MKRIEQLTQLIRKETEIIEKLITVMDNKQDAIVKMKAWDINNFVQMEEQLLDPLKILEDERIRLMGVISNELNKGTNKVEHSQMTLGDLMKCLSKYESVQISEQADQLRTAVDRMMKKNEQNKVLLNHSQRFVQGTLKILTENYKKQFVDQKM